MRKGLFIVISVCLLISTSCNKGGPGAAGFWTFQGNAFDAASCSGAFGQLNASNANNNNEYNYGTITCQFHQTLPAKGGTYTVVVYPPQDSTQVSVGLTIDGGNMIAYSSTGGGGSETVKVTVNNGLVSVIGSGIMMLNTSGQGTDSSALSININQTQ
jgi:hypothetical protein